LADERWAFRRKEIARAREVVCDFLSRHQYVDDGVADAYFMDFAVAARRGAGRG
jgi:hypothetical protein